LAEAHGLITDVLNDTTLPPQAIGNLRAVASLLAPPTPTPTTQRVKPVVASFSLAEVSRPTSSDSEEIPFVNEKSSAFSKVLRKLSGNISSLFSVDVELDKTTEVPMTFSKSLCSVLNCLMVSCPFPVFFLKQFYVKVIYKEFFTLSLQAKNKTPLQSSSGLLRRMSTCTWSTTTTATGLPMLEPEPSRKRVANFRSSDLNSPSSSSGGNIPASSPGKTANSLSPSKTPQTPTQTSSKSSRSYSTTSIPAVGHLSQFKKSPLGDVSSLGSPASNPASLGHLSCSSDQALQEEEDFDDEDIEQEQETHLQLKVFSSRIREEDEDEEQEDDDDQEDDETAVTSSSTRDIEPVSSKVCDINLKNKDRVIEIENSPSLDSLSKHGHQEQANRSSNNNRSLLTSDYDSSSNESPCDANLAVTDTSTVIPSTSASTSTTYLKGPCLLCGRKRARASLESIHRKSISDAGKKACWPNTDSPPPAIPSRLDPFGRYIVKDGQGYDLEELSVDPLLNLITEWDYPIFELKEAAGDAILSEMSYRIFYETGLLEAFKIPLQEFLNYFRSLECGYKEKPCEYLSCYCY